MKTKRILGFILSLAMLLSIMSLAVSAEAPATVLLGGVEIADGEYLASGGTEPVSAQPEGGYALYKDGVLTLNNFEYTGPGVSYLFDEGVYYYSTLFSSGDLEVVLEGVNKLNNTTDDGDGITAMGDLTISGKGKLHINAFYGIYAYSMENATSVTINGGDIIIDATESGILNVCFASYNADVTVNGGNLDISAEYMGIGATGSDTEITVNGGKVSINSGDASISAYADYNNTVTISGGEVDLTSDFVGIEASGSEAGGDVLVNGGKLSVNASYYCLAMDTTYFNNGDVYLYCGPEGNLFNGDYVYGNRMTMAYTPEGVDYILIMTEHVSGDVNLDMNVDMYDYLMIKSIYFGAYDCHDCEFIRADVYPDGNVDMYDYMAVKSMYFASK